MSLVERTATDGRGHRLFVLQAFVTTGATWIAAGVVAPTEPALIYLGALAAVAVVGGGAMIGKRLRKTAIARIFYNAPTLTTLVVMQVALQFGGLGNVTAVSASSSEITGAKQFVLSIVMVALLVEWIIVPYVVRITNVLRTAIAAIRKVVSVKVMIVSRSDDSEPFDVRQRIVASDDVGLGPAERNPATPTTP